MKYNESKPFSSGTEYDAFLCYWCERCTHYKLRDGFPEFPENGGCPVLDAMEYARLDINLFPRKEIIEEQDDNGNIVYYHKCRRFMKEKQFSRKDGQHEKHDRNIKRKSCTNTGRHRQNAKDLQ